MACKDKRKVWVDVKRHDRRVLKCQNKAAQRKRISKKKITKPLNIADFARARYPRQPAPKRAARKFTHFYPKNPPMFEN